MQTIPQKHPNQTLIVDMLVQIINSHEKNESLTQKSVKITKKLATQITQTFEQSPAPPLRALRALQRASQATAHHDGLVAWETGRHGDLAAFRLDPRTPGLSDPRSEGRNGRTFPNPVNPVLAKIGLEKSWPNTVRKQWVA